MNSSKALSKGFPDSSSVEKQVLSPSKFEHSILAQNVIPPKRKLLGNCVGSPSQGALLLSEEGRTIQKGVQIEGSAQTQGERYF